MDFEALGNTTTIFVKASTQSAYKDGTDTLASEDISTAIKSYDITIVDLKTHLQLSQHLMIS